MSTDGVRVRVFSFCVVDILFLATFPIIIYYDDIYILSKYTLFQQVFPFPILFHVKLVTISDIRSDQMIQSQ